MMQNKTIIVQLQHRKFF